MATVDTRTFANHHARVSVCLSFPLFFLDSFNSFIEVQINEVIRSRHTFCSYVEGSLCVTSMYVIIIHHTRW